MTEIAFETFGVIAYFDAFASHTSVYASGNRSGVVVNFGWNETSVAGFHEGLPVPASYKFLNYGSKNIDEILKNKLSLKYSNLSAYFTLDMCRRWKEKYLSFYKIPESKSFLFQNSTISVESEAEAAADIYFDPGQFGLSEPSLPSAITDSIKTLITSQNVTKPYIYCVGSGAKIPNLANKIRSSLKDLKIPLLVSDPFTCGEQSWSGASMVASFSSFQKMWISREEYQGSLL